MKVIYLAIILIMIAVSTGLSSISFMETALARDHGCPNGLVPDIDSNGQVSKDSSSGETQCLSP